MQTSILSNKTIYLRAENIPSECRTPLVPRDISILSQAGFTIYVQSSTTRIYSDQEYSVSGAHITDLSWTDHLFQDVLIIGLKTLPDLDQLSGHRHLYFAHSFKNQSGSDIILRAFHESNSELYDFEYLTDVQDRRILAFGEYAGYVGAGLGLMQFFTKFTDNRNICDLHSWTSKADFLQQLQSIVEMGIFTGLSIGIIGPNGRCGRGVCEILDNFNLKYAKIGRNSPKTDLLQYDILYNCILLDTDLNETWISAEDVNNCGSCQKVLVDISCDVSKINNPFRELYQNTGSWTTPVLSVGPFFDAIVLDNLPSFLPKDSSDYFSEKCTTLLKNNDEKIWENAKSIFTKAAFSLYYKSLNSNDSKNDSKNDNNNNSHNVSIYVVNFNDENRRERMARRFFNLNMPMHFTAPVYSNDERLNMPELSEGSKRTCSIMLQHLDSLRHFLNNSVMEYCIVCEDDIMVSKNLPINLPQILSKFKEMNLDVLLLGYLWPYDIHPDYNYHFSRLSQDDKFQYTKYPNDLWGSQMYLVSRSHAQFLLNTFPSEYAIPGKIVGGPEDGSDRLPYNPDWTLTKKGHRAIITPMLAVEEGDSKLGGSGECQFHQRCFLHNYIEGVHI